MSIALALLTQGLHVALVLAAAPCLMGWLDCLNARLAGRNGPPLRQSWLDLRRLLRKQPVRPDYTTPLSAMAPLAAFTVLLTAAALVPSFTLGMALAPLADLVAIVALLGLGRVILALVALDAGTGPEGFAATQTMSASLLTEPALLLVVLALALLSGSANLDVIAGQQLEGLLQPSAACTLAAAALAGVALTDAAEPPLPLDTQLSGPDLALLQLARALRLLVWLDLIGALFLPLGMARAEAGPLAWLVGLGAWACRVAGFAAVLAVLRAITGPLRWRHMPSYLGVAALLAALAAMLVLANARLA